MATKKDIMEIKIYNSLINSSIADIREIFIKALVSGNLIACSLEANTKEIEENFCPFVSIMGFMFRQLKRGNIIFSTWTGRGRVFVRMRERDKPMTFNHPDEIVSAFSDFYLFLTLFILFSFAISGYYKFFGYDDNDVNIRKMK